MSGFSEVERDEIAVQFIRVPDGLDEIGRAWNELEAVVAPRGGTSTAPMTRLLTTIAPASRCERETSSRPGSSLAGCQAAAISERG